MISTKTFREAVVLANKAIEKTGMPVLSTVRLRIDGNEFSVATSSIDTTVTVRGKTASPVTRPLDMLIVGKTLSTVLTGLKKVNGNPLPGLGKVGTVSFSLDWSEATDTIGNVPVNSDNVPVSPKARMTAGARTFKFETMASDLFPADIELTGTKNEFTMTEAQLADLAWVAAVRSTDEGRFAMSGVFFDKGSVIATDTHRLHKVDNLIPPGITGILRGNVHALLMAAMETTGAKVATIAPYTGGATGYDNHNIKVFALTAEGRDLSVEIRSRPVEGQFPPYTSVLPRNSVKIASLPADALKDALLLTKGLVDSRIRMVRLSANGALEVAVMGEGDDTVFAEEMDCTTETPMVWGMNVRYLEDAINDVDGTVEIAGQDADSPFLFQSPSAPERLALIMPMRLNTAK